MVRVLIEVSLSNGILGLSARFIGWLVGFICGWSDLFVLTGLSTGLFHHYARIGQDLSIILGAHRLLNSVLGICGRICSAFVKFGIEVRLVNENFE